MITRLRLRHAASLAEHAKNSRRAAATLRISQPALTKSIQALEAALGVQLFERRQRRSAAHSVWRVRPGARPWHGARGIRTPAPDTPRGRPGNRIIERRVRTIAGHDVGLPSGGRVARRTSEPQDLASVSQLAGGRPRRRREESGSRNRRDRPGRHARRLGADRFNRTAPRAFPMPRWSSDSSRTPHHPDSAAGIPLGNRTPSAAHGQSIPAIHQARRLHRCPQRRFRSSNRPFGSAEPRHADRKERGPGPRAADFGRARIERADPS